MANKYFHYNLLIIFSIIRLFCLKNNRDKWHGNISTYSPNIVPLLYMPLKVDTVQNIWVSRAPIMPHRHTQTSTNDKTFLIKIRSHHRILGRYFISYIDAFCNQMWVQSNNSNTNITNAVWEPGTGLKQGVHSLYIASS